MKANCTACHGLVMAIEQESLKDGNFDSSEDNDGSTKNDLLLRVMFYTRNNRSEDSFECAAVLAQAALKVAKLASFFSKTTFFGERRGQRERSGTSKVLPESLSVFPLQL